MTWYQLLLIIVIQILLNSIPSKALWWSPKSSSHPGWWVVRHDPVYVRKLGSKK